MGAFVLGPRSRAELVGVDADLVAVVESALARSPVDFAVHDGKRTAAEQAAFVAKGVSQTMDSKHLVGDAVDLVPYLRGALRWEWPALFQIAGVVRAAAIERGIRLRWGGAWDVTFTDTAESPETVSAGYVARRKAARRKVFLDGPHFELVR